MMLGMTTSGEHSGSEYPFWDASASDPEETDAAMIIDCDDCTMQHTDACDDCVVTALLHITSHPVHLREDESTALVNLADVGLVAPLRLVPNGIDATGDGEAS